MADVRLNIASREYVVTCRDGEENRLESLGAMVDEMVREAGGSAGGMNESRQLLFASLLLADKLHDLNNGKKAASSQPASANVDTEQFGVALERLAERLETLAVKLEN
jgi:cell division protein ZapA